MVGRATSAVVEASVGRAAMAAVAATAVAAEAAMAAVAAAEAAAAAATVALGAQLAVPKRWRSRRPWDG